MPGAGDSNRRIPSVFDKLSGVDSRVEFGQNLVYPRDLGEDEYNHFVLFTMYEKDSQEEQIEQRRKIVNETQRDFLANIEQMDNASTILEVLEAAGIGAGAAVYDKIAELADAGIALTSELINDVILPLLPERTEKRESQFLPSLDMGRQYEQFLNSQSDSAVRKARNDLGLDIKFTAENPVFNRVRLSAATYKSPTNIALYIPQKLVNNGTISYNGVNFEIAQAAFGMLAGGDLSSAGPAVRRSMAGMLDAITGLVGVPVNATEAITAVTGLAINPREEQLFQGVQSRSFDMTFKLVPRSAEEAVEVSNIVRAFRKYSHPSVRAGSFFLALPAEFDIRYYRIDENGTAEENLFLNRIGRCALTSVGVDYSPSSVSSFFHDGSPVATALTLSFTEFRPLTREDIEEGF